MTFEDVPLPMFTPPSHYIRVRRTVTGGYLIEHWTNPDDMVWPDEATEVGKVRVGWWALGDDLKVIGRLIANSFDEPRAGSRHP